MQQRQTTVKIYKTEKQFQQDAARMAKKGWRVVSSMQEKPRSGCGRIAFLGIFAAVFPPKPVFVVTYEREANR